MAELNLKQIENRLNEEFHTGGDENRKLIFWYDDRAEFSEDVDSLQLDGAKILHLMPDNQFATKLFLEREDRTTNYLIYAPFPKPDVHENHLEDMRLYSRRFYADRASLLAADLDISEEWKPVLEKHIRFFANKKRTKKFYDLGINPYDGTTIRLGMMCALAGARTCSLEETLRLLLDEESRKNHRIFDEFARYDLTDSFWDLCTRHFGLAWKEPGMAKLVLALFVTCTAHEIMEPLPDSWEPFRMRKTGNAIAFLDSMMNSVVYQTVFDKLSYFASQQLHAADSLKTYPLEHLAACSCFADIDTLLIHWIAGRLEAEDVDAHLGDYSIPELCEFRKKTHFGQHQEQIYDMFICAGKLERLTSQSYPGNFQDIIKAYENDLYLIDRAYRHFYYHLDQLADASVYEPLRVLIENMYTNEYLGKVLPEWNRGIMEDKALDVIPLQRNFYNHYVAGSKDRVVVIISDALRYETGRELFDRLADNPRSEVKIEAMLSTLPSYTRLGMSALLPHRKLELSPEGKELVDGTYCIDLQSREKVLQAQQPLARCVAFDDLKHMKTRDMRDIFTGQQVIYVYHDQIDVRGEHAEDEVFQACAEAVKEILDFIEKVHNGVNTRHFIVTADHGFIYKRNKVQESDKIGNVHHYDIVKRRYIISQEGVQEDGVQNLNLGYLLGNEDTRMVSFPIGTSVFKTRGSGGQNYVHGGSSPQEMLVPVIEARMERGKADVRAAQIHFINTMNKITNLITTLDFIQSEPVGEAVKEATYLIGFVDAEGQPISNEITHVADSRENEAAKRTFRLRFTFKNQDYDVNQSYFLVIKDAETGIDVFRHPFIMDLPFAGDFGFDL